MGDLLKRITNPISSLSKGLSSKSVTSTAPQTSSYPFSSPRYPPSLLLPRGNRSSVHGKKKFRKSL
tara:strand:+ start:2003 stop:2200 length:198 start_codon:yes stop_codon:yes gene_type:complete